MDFDFKNPEYFTHVLAVNGKLLEVPLRRGRSDSAFIDYLTFTVGKSTFHDEMNQQIVWFSEPDDEIYIHFISQKLENIFGFGITEKRQGKGKFFYNAYYQLGLKELNYGTVHIGGQRGTVLIDLSATGCQAAVEGWEQRLYKFALTADRFVISRIDAACDFLNGEYSVEKGLHHYKKGQFDVKGMRPKYKLDGLDWFNHDNSGKTLYIGRRGSSKFCRIYEKGKQLGDTESPWVRFEIEFRKNDCLIPNDILIYPGQYLSGAYPIGQKLFVSPSKRVSATDRKAKSALQEKIYHARNQVGKLIRYMTDAGWEAQTVVNALIAQAGEYPKGLKPLEYDCRAVWVEYRHHQTVQSPDMLTDLEMVQNLNEALQQSTLCDDTVLQEFLEDVEYWQWFKLTVPTAKNQRAAQAELKRLLDELFNKYSELAYYQP